MQRGTSSESKFKYRRDILLGLASALLIAILLVNFWPEPQHEEPRPVYTDQHDDLVQIEEIPTSRQPQAPPPPPRPLPPIEVPDRTELEEMQVDFTEELSDEDWLEESPPAPEGDQVAQSSRPDVPARQLRLVEPRYSQEARSEGIRARVTIEVLVDEDGSVKEANIREMILLDDQNRPKREVDELGYGLEDAALDAARRTTFVPAEVDGDRVESRTTITIRFGV